MTRPSPSEAAVDSQPVEAATMICIDVAYDAIKKIHGRKQHLSVSEEVTLLTHPEATTVLLLECSIARLPIN
ncbi:hypothetical protein [Nostoc sp. KVJ3]|uniref:hypothetical protein n=1 Tax=Nostoc sp. KVJ3 TaxID=457945 RepID=UPI00223907CE|nr:hypothetical protein [Nostoc sp. KVJ3]